jgi:hypothetical protein
VGKRTENCVRKSDAIPFLKEHKVEFGLKYVRGDMRLWTEDDMILVAILSHAPSSKEFRKDLVQFIKANAVKDYVSREEYDSLLERLKALESAVPALQVAASAAGTALQAQKGTRHLRLVVG